MTGCDPELAAGLDHSRLDWEQCNCPMVPGWNFGDDESKIPTEHLNIIPGNPKIKSNSNIRINVKHGQRVRSLGRKDSAANCDPIPDWR
jgi:hypothetical protein